MVKRRTTSRKLTKKVIRGKTYVCKPTAASKVKYKKCILTAIRGTKITTRKTAQKAFRAAAKKCGGLLTGMKARKGGRRKKSTRARRTLPGMTRRRGVFPSRMSKRTREYLRSSGIRGM